MSQSQGQNVVFFCELAIHTALCSLVAICAMVLGVEGWTYDNDLSESDCMLGGHGH